MTQNMDFTTKIIGMDRLKQLREMRYENPFASIDNLNEDGTRYCRWCGETLTGRKTAYCSEECASEYGALWYKWFTWEGIRKRIIMRDKNTCATCKKVFPTSQLEVHHKLPRSRGGTDREENLITLCKEHHRIETNLLLGAKSFDITLKTKQKTLKELIS